LKKNKASLLTVLFNDEGLIELDRVLDPRTRHPYTAEKYYRSLKKYIRWDIITKVDSQISQHHELLSDGDRRLIENLSRIPKANYWAYLSIIGVLNQSSIVISESREADTSKTVLASAYLWTLLNLFESLKRYLWEYSRDELCKVSKRAEQLDRNNRTPTIGQLKALFVQIGWVEKKDATLLSDILELRNALGHGDVYYDEEREVFKIALRGFVTGEELSSVLLRTQGFINLLIQSLQPGVTIAERLDSYASRIARHFKKVQRSGDLWKAFMNLDRERILDQVYEVGSRRAKTGARSVGRDPTTTISSK